MGRGKGVSLSVCCGLDLGRKKGFPRVFSPLFPLRGLISMLGCKSLES